MATLQPSTIVQEIGEVAGQVWKLLNKNGPVKLTQLVKQVDAPRDQVMQAVGWLAREEKIRIDEKSRSRVISLL